MVIRKRGGRKLVTVPDGAATTHAKSRVEETLVKALARAYRWKRLLEAGQFASMADLAATEKINHSYVRRNLRLTLLSPGIVEVILDGRQSRQLNLETLLRPFPVEWVQQADWLNSFDAAYKEGGVNCGISADQDGAVG